MYCGKFACKLLGQNDEIRKIVDIYAANQKTRGLPGSSWLKLLRPRLLDLGFS